MGDFIFFVKSLFMTLIFIVLLQVRVGQTTLEEKAVFFLQTSPIVQPLDQVAQGAVLVIRDFIKNITGNLKNKFWQSVDTNNQPGVRSLGVKLQRSAKYLEEKAKETKTTIKQELETRAWDSFNKADKQVPDSSSP